MDDHQGVSEGAATSMVSLQGSKTFFLLELVNMSRSSSIWIGILVDMFCYVKLCNFATFPAVVGALQSSIFVASWTALWLIPIR